MKPCLVRHWVDRIDSDGPLPSEAETVAVDRIKGNLGHVEGCKRPVLIPRWHLRFGQWLTVRLREHKPVRSIHKPCRGGRFFGSVVGRCRRPLDGHGPAKRDRLLALANVPPQFLPSLKGRDRSRLDSSLYT